MELKAYFFYVFTDVLMIENLYSNFIKLIAEFIF